MFIDFFLKLQEQGKHVLVCPDLMYYTGANQDLLTEESWVRLAKKWSLQGISMNRGPQKMLTFECDQVDLVCQPEEQTRSHLVPWCCMESAYHVVRVMNRINKAIDVHYELDSGSLLGNLSQ